MNNGFPGHDAHKDYRRHRRLVRMGQVIMAMGVLVGLSHWIAHIVVTGGPPGLQDLLIGYPTAAALLIAGAILAGRATPSKKR